MSERTLSLSFAGIYSLGASVMLIFLSTQIHSDKLSELRMQNGEDEAKGILCNIYKLKVTSTCHFKVLFNS